MNAEIIKLAKDIAEGEQMFWDGEPSNNLTERLKEINWLLTNSWDKEPLFIKDVTFYDTGSYEGTEIQDKIEALDGKTFTVLATDHSHAITGHVARIVHPDGTVWFDRKTYRETNFFKDPFQNTVFCFLESCLCPGMT